VPLVARLKLSETPWPGVPMSTRPCVHTPPPMMASLRRAGRGALRRGLLGARDVQVSRQVGRRGLRSGLLVARERGLYRSHEIGRERRIGREIEKDTKLKTSRVGKLGLRVHDRAHHLEAHLLVERRVDRLDGFDVIARERSRLGLAE